MGRIGASAYQFMSIRARNACVIEMVREACRTYGYFAGWLALSNLCSRIKLPSALVVDVLTSVRVYDTIRPAAAASRPTSSGLVMTITRGEFSDSLYHVAPKNLGGRAWMSSDEYLSAHRTWSNTGFGLLSPCISFGWLAVQRKTISRADVDHCDAMTLLGGVDFDMDRGEAFGSGFTEAMEIARHHIAETGTRMQATALAALLNHDLQKYVRPIQETWVRDGRGAANFGPQQIPADDWVAAEIADSTGICPYGYEGASVYPQSRGGSFTGLLLCNTHDLIYDLATSNLMSSVMYAAAAGITNDNFHCIFVTSCADAIAQRVCGSPNSEHAVFGDNALFAIGVWAGFSTRYRTWERFVKYSRQIASSKSTEVKHIMENAVRQRILVDSNLFDISDAWRKLTSRADHHDTIPRPTVVYHPSAASEITEALFPDICATCIPPFKEALNAFASDEIHGVEGLPEAAVQCRAVAIAAAIRRAAIFATSEGCCGVCACRIGC
ncbi:hypothetical protein C8R44DRAFT_949462 [Mycena epipterygia]|nr:hypothetical protein C8R44DRAFT_949462 [Mycena epipterygia]